MDQLGTITYVNNAVQRVLGYRPEELTGRSGFDLIDPDDIPRAREDFSKAIAISAGNTIPNAFHLRHADGSIRVLEGLGTNLLDDPIVQGYVMNVRDVTDRNQAEDILRYTEARYRLLFDHSPDGIVIVDPATARILEFNDTAHQQLGYSREEFARLSIHDLDVLEVPETTRLAIAEVIRQGSKDFETKHRAQEGEIRDVSVRAQIMEVLGLPVYHCVWRDITDQKRADEALKASEEKYRKIFEGATEGIFQTTPEGRYLSINPAFARMFGYASAREMIDAVTNIGQQRFVNPEDREEMVRRLRQKDKIDMYEVEVYHKDGSPFWISINIHTVRDQSGKILYFEGTNVDITKRKAAENELQKLASIVRHSSELISLFTPDGRMVFLNETGCRILGIDPDRVNEFNLQDVVPEHLQRMVQTEHLPALTKVGRWEGEFQYKNLKTGRSVHVYAMTFVIGDPVSGAPLYYAHVSRDITENKHAAEMLRLSEEKFSKVFMTTPDCIAISRMTDGMIIDVNLGFEEITGWKRSEIIGQAAGENNFWVEASERSLMVSELRAGRDILHREFRLRRKDGSVRIGIYSARPIQIAGEASIIFIFRDITDQRSLAEDRHKLEQQLLQAQKMEAIGTLAGGIAHDFNNILGVIMGYTELAGMQPDVTDNLRYQERVLSACDRAKSLVRQILTFARHTESERKPLDLKLLLKESLKLLASTIPATIEIRQQITTQACTINGDPTQMHQILMNLCTNAVHAMGEKGGVLEISLAHEKIADAGLLSVPDLKPGAYIKLVVSDSGAGIDPAIMDRIFDPFFTTKPVDKGTGLGLSVAYGIVKNHDGKISVYSKPGEGTTFTVYIPDADEDVPKGINMPKDPVPTGCRNEHILFVDDEKILAELGGKMLTALGYDVTTCTGSMEALKLFHLDPRRFDLVITDMTMPHMTGKELARALLAMRGDIPIVICTGYSEYMDGGIADELGVKALMMKPFSKRDLAKTVRETLDKAGM